ncbi:MAG: DegV family protein [Deinococcus sp.]|nr:DegV family protein [Deinococcus sp.]
MTIAIVTDSTSDLSAQRRAELQVEAVPLYVLFKGQTFRDGLDMTTQDLFQGVAQGAPLPSTSQPSPADFQVVYQRLLETHQQIISLHLSAGVSGTFNSAAQAARLMAPAQVHVVDSQLVSGGLGMMVEEACRLRDAGASVPDILQAVDHIRRDYLLLFSVGGLEYLHKNGRIGGAQAFLGSILNVRPVLALRGGKVDAYARVRGAKKAARVMVEALAAYATSPINLGMIEANGEAAAEELAQAIEQAQIPVVRRQLFQIGPVVASHAGPGAYGFFAYKALE